MSTVVTGIGPPQEISTGELGAVFTNYGPVTVSYSDQASVREVAEGAILSGASVTLYGTVFLDSVGKATVNVAQPVVPGNVQLAARLSTAESNLPLTTSRLEIAGDSWTSEQSVAEWGWPTLLRRLLGLDSARYSNLGVVGATYGRLEPSAEISVAGRVLRSAHGHYSDVNPTSSGDWVNPSRYAILSTPFNDAATRPSCPLTAKAGMRAAISRYRAARVLEGDTGSLVTTSAGWNFQATAASGLEINSGGSFMWTVTAGATVTCTLPADYDGRPLAIGYSTNGAAHFRCTVTVKAGSATIGTFNMRAEALERPLSLTYPGVLRIPGGAPVGTSTITVEATSIDSGGWVSFDHLTMEGDPLVLVVLKPTPPAAIDPGGTATAAITLSNTWARSVAAEYPAREVVVVDLNARAEFSDRNYWSAVGDPHPNYRGHAVIASALLEAIATTGPSSKRRAGAG